MRINFNNIQFVRKDRALLSHPHKTILEEPKTGYVYEKNGKGVAIIPYRIGPNGKEVLIRDEYTPIHDTVLSIITGGKEPDEKGSDWWRDTARRELEEEAGIVADRRWFEYVGELLAAGSQKDLDVMCIVDVTGLPQKKPSTDGSIYEKKSVNMWVPVIDLLRMVREPRSDMDSYLLAAVTKFLVWNGMLNVDKSEETDLMKAKKGEQKPGHKYIRREGSEGKYKYIYTEPKGKTGKVDEKGKPKGGLLAQLTELLGQKKNGSEEEKPKKLLPFDAWPTAPKDLPEFSKGVSASQWIAGIERMVDTNVAKEIAGIEDGVYELMNDPNAKYGYIDQAIKIMDYKNSRYAGSEANLKDLNVENKKLDEQAKTEVKKAMLQASSVLGIVNHTIAVLNSSITENIFSSVADRIKAADSKEVFSDYPELEKLSFLVHRIKTSLNVADNIMQDIKWLQGSDPKLDWLVDSVFNSVDQLMKTRNRFVQNTFSMYLEQISGKIDSLDDNYAIESSIRLIDSLQSFKEDSMYSSMTARDNKNFANQWNMKQKGIYSGASRFTAHATSKVIDKIRSLQGTKDADDTVISQLITSLSEKRAFSFLSFNRLGANSFHVSEQQFSYINEHGLDKYYQDTLFIAGGRNLSSDEKGFVNVALNTIDMAYSGEDVFESKIASSVENKIGKPLGDMVRGVGRSMYFDYAAFNSAINTIALLNDKTPITAKVPAFIRMWSSASHNSLMSNAVEAFVDAKGIDRGTYVNYHIASNRVVNTRRLDIKDSLSKTIRAIYENTQKELGDRSFTLYRGNGVSEIKSAVSSWTSDRGVAENFGHVISSAEVPVEAILINRDYKNINHWSYPYEHEHVVVPGLLPLDRRFKAEVVSNKETDNIIND